MVEENAATGARLDGELERARGECATLRGELRDVRGALPVVLNNNNGAGNNNGGAGAAGNSSNNNGGGVAAANAGNNGVSPGQEGGEPQQQQQQQSQDDGKRLSAGSSPVEKRSSASDKSASPIDKRTSPVDRKERTSPIDRRTSPIGTWRFRSLSVFARGRLAFVELFWTLRHACCVGDFFHFTFRLFGGRRDRTDGCYSIGLKATVPDSRSNNIYCLAGAESMFGAINDEHVKITGCWFWNNLKLYYRRIIIGSVL